MSKTYSNVEFAKSKETKVLFRLSPGEKKMLQAFAKKAGISVSAYIRIKAVHEPAQGKQVQLGAK